MDSLFSEFPESNIEEWKKKLIKDLKGITFEELTTLDDNDIQIFPFYTIENAENRSLQVFSNPDWEILSKVIVQNEAEANKKALNDLNSGATALMVELDNLEEVNWDFLLKEINLKHIYAHFKLGNHVHLLDSFQNYLEKQHIKLDSLNCSVEYDPIGNYFIHQEIPFDPVSYEKFISQSNDFRNITVNTSIYQNAGANSTSQLAYGLGQLNEYLHVLSAQHHSLQNLKINFKVAVGTNFFEEVSKLRALRILIANLLNAYQAKGDVFISAETSELYQSNLDRYNNMLRDSISGMACILGGCDSLFIHGFDENSLGITEFNERMARNQQLIFKEESFLNKVADIPAGSFYLESLSTEIAEKSWSLFQTIEKQGGLLHYFEIGELNASIEKQAQQLIEEYKNGTRVFIGVNKHRNKHEKDNHPFLEKPATQGIQSINIAFELQKSL